MWFFTQSSWAYQIQKFMVAWIVACVCEMNEQLLTWNIMCWCRAQALPLENCRHISWPERLVSQELIRMMKTMRSLRRCWSRPRALRSDSHRHVHLRWHLQVYHVDFLMISKNFQRTQAQENVPELVSFSAKDSLDPTQQLHWTIYSSIWLPISIGVYTLLARPMWYDHIWYDDMSHLHNV